MFSKNHTVPRILKQTIITLQFNYLRTGKIYSLGMPQLGVPYRMDCS